MEIIIVLYLWDNDTSNIILFIGCTGIAINLWKIQSIIIVKIYWHNKLCFDIKFAGDYESSGTSQYDMEVYRYMIWLLPVVLAVTLYNLMYYDYKGWYSWIISSLSSLVYAFGFIMMIPQVFINYKLKSVAGMPWRSMVYKTLNTFIDDLFAFSSKMPTMHRLSVFRDDIIFFVYLYQRWIYPIDAQRINEFGDADTTKVQESNNTHPQSFSDTQGIQNGTVVPGTPTSKKRPLAKSDTTEKNKAIRNDSPVTKSPKKRPLVSSTVYTNLPQKRITTVQQANNTK